MKRSYHEINYTSSDLNHIDTINYLCPPAPAFERSKSDLSSVVEELESNLDVFSELRSNQDNKISPRKRRNSLGGFMASRSARRPSIILNPNSHPMPVNVEVEVEPKPNNYESKIVARKVIRALYLLELLYVAYVFPVLVVSSGVYIPYLYLFLDCFQLIYMGLLIGGKPSRSAHENCKKLVSFETVSLLAVIPLEFFGYPFLNYLFYLKALRLVSIRKEIRFFYRKTVKRTYNKFWGLMIGLHCAVIWMATFWLSVSKWMDPNNEGWYATHCAAHPEPGKCIVEAIYLVLQACLTIGYGDITPITLGEKIVMSVYMVVGVVIFSYFLASFSNFFDERYSRPNYKESYVECLNRIERKLPVDQHKVTSELIRRATKIITNQNALHMEEEENFDLLDLLPYETQARLSQHFNTMLGSLDFFKRFPVFNIVELLPSMKELLFEEGEIVTKYGNPSECILIIRTGFLLAAVPSCYKLPADLYFAYFRQKWSVGEHDVFPACRPHRFNIVAGARSRLLALDGYSLKVYLDKSEEAATAMNIYAKDKLLSLSVLLRATIRRYYEYNGALVQITATSELLEDRTDSITTTDNSLSKEVTKELNDLLGEEKSKLQEVLYKLRECQTYLDSKIATFYDLERHLPQFYKGESAFKPSIIK